MESEKPVLIAFPDGTLVTRLESVVRVFGIVRELPIFNAHCTATDALICSFEAADFDEAAVRLMQIFNNEKMVEIPMGNVRLSLHQGERAISSPFYFLNGWFCLLNERRKTTH
jgi:hypothetical protein